MENYEKNIMIFAIFISTVVGIIYVFLEVVVYILDLVKKGIIYIKNGRL